MDTLNAVLNRFAEAVPIDEGWSEDRKFCVTDFEGKKFLLRPCALEKAGFKRMEFAQDAKDPGAAGGTGGKRGGLF